MSNRLTASFNGGEVQPRGQWTDPFAFHAHVTPCEPNRALPRRRPTGSANDMSEQDTEGWETVGEKKRVAEQPPLYVVLITSRVSETSQNQVHLAGPAAAQAC